MEQLDDTKAHRDKFLWRFRLKSFVTLGITIAAMFLLPLFISSSTSWSYWRTFNAVAGAFLTLLMLTIFVRLLFFRSRARPVLLDAGPYPQRRLYILTASVWLVALIVNLNFSQTVSSFIESDALKLSLTAFYALLSFGRLQVHREGIWLYNGLLPWHKIKAHRWRGGTLYFETKGVHFWTQSSCVMLEKHAEAFEAYLLEHDIPDNTADLAVTT